MIYPLPGALSQLWEDAPVAIARMLSYDHSNMPHQGLFLPRMIGAILSVVVGALGKLDRFQAPA